MIMALLDLFPTCGCAVQLDTGHASRSSHLDEKGVGELTLDDVRPA